MKEMVIRTKTKRIIIIKGMMAKDIIVGIITSIDDGNFKGDINILEIERTNHVDPFSATYVLMKGIDMYNVHINIKPI